MNILNHVLKNVRICYKKGSMLVAVFFSMLLFGSSPALHAQVSVANWNQIDFPADTNSNFPNIIAIAYGNNTYVAVGFGGNQKSLYVSSDGITWTNDSTSALPLPNTFPDDLVFMDSAFKLSTGGSIYTSTDLQTWTFESTHLVFTARNLKKVNTLYFQGGEGNFATSTNGTTWTNPLTGADFLDLAYGNNTYVLVGRQAARGIIYSSTDGVAWDTVISVSDSQEMFYAVDFHNGQFILAGNNGVIGKSTDGNNWTFSTVSGATTATFFSIRHILNHWVLSAGFRVFYSADGDTWTESTINPGTIGNLKRIESFEGAGYIPGNNGRIIRTDVALSLSNNVKLNNKLHVYPNPVSREIRISIDGNQQYTSPIAILIFNMQGQKLKEVTLKDEAMGIDISDLPVGLYMYQITNDNNVLKHGKLIKHE